MSDMDGGASAPADSAPAPTPEVAVSTPNPVSTESRQEPVETKPEVKAEKPEPKADKPLTTREALQKAKEKVEADDKPAEVKTAPKADKTDVKADTKTEVKPETKTEPSRDETGKFASKDPKPAELAKEPPKASFTASEPPARFSADAKARWAEAHESIRGETERAIRELTEGHAKYKTDAEEFHKVREFHDMARHAGKELPNVIREYVNMENLLHSDAPKGIEAILNRLGTTPRAYAEMVLGQSPDHSARAQDDTIRELRQQIQTLSQSVGQVTQTFQQQREQTALTEVQKFAQDNPRFEELADDIAFFMKSGRAKDLSEAYQMADRLNPAPKAPDLTTAASSAPLVDLTAQTEKGQKSIAGSPDSGSNPTKRQPSKSIKDSVRNAFQRAS